MRAQRSTNISVKEKCYGFAKTAARAERKAEVVKRAERKMSVCIGIVERQDDQGCGPDNRFERDFGVVALEHE